jgi:hypothetical protein
VKRDLDELMSAWADDPRSLSPEERAEVEALVDGSPALRRDAEETRALLGRLRELPPDGDEPAWDEFARTLRGRIDDAQPGPVRRWLDRWWKPAFGLGLVAAAAAVVIVARHQQPADAPADPPRTAARAPDAGVAPLPVPGPDLAAPEDTDPFAFGAIGEIAAEDLDDRVVAALGADDDLSLDGDAHPEDGLVPDLSLDWVDELDDDQIDRVDEWLAQR